jgi:hypothetical protein
MFDYSQIDYIIRKQKYCLWKLTDDTFDIIKNEHGTFGEYFDFIITVKIDINTNIVSTWEISNSGTSSKNYIQEIEGKINNIVYKDILIEDMCFSIANKI